MRWSLIIQLGCTALSVERSGATSVVFSIGLESSDSLSGSRLIVVPLLLLLLTLQGCDVIVDVMVARIDSVDWNLNPIRDLSRGTVTLLIAFAPMIRAEQA